MTVKCLDNTNKSNLVRDFHKYPQPTKTALGSEYGVSARTVGRVLQEYEEELENSLSNNNNNINDTSQTSSTYHEEGYA